MKFFSNLNISQRIVVVVTSVLAVIFLVSAVAIFSLSKHRTMKMAEVQMTTYLTKLSEIISLVEKNSEPGFTNNDYAQLKPYFNENAFFETDYPFLVDNSGSILIHLYKEGQKYSRDHLKKMNSNPYSQGYFFFEDYGNNANQKMVTYFKKVEPYNYFVAVSLNQDEIISSLKTNRLIIIVLFALGAFGFVVIISYTLKPFVTAVKKINDDILVLAKGQIASKIEYNRNDEVGQIVKSLNRLIEGLQLKTKFSDEIAKNKLDTDFVPLSDNDVLGNSLLNMRKSLIQSAEENAQRKKEDEIRNWTTSGIAKFGDILRQNNNNLQALSDNVTQNLINYLDANQGGLFMLNEAENREQFLELVSAFAFNRKKAKTKIIMLGEGLVGNCAVEKQAVYLKEIPEDYIEITSGLGDAPPRSLLIVPLKLEEKIFGVVEVASFKEFQPYEIDFVEKVGESIAATLSSVKNNIKTNQLLQQSQQQREEMSAQEEEMRQNMEEMQATQEEMMRKTLEMEGMTSAINEALIFAELNEQGSFILANPNFMALTGFGKHDLESKALIDFIHPDEYATYKALWKEVLGGNPFKGTLKWLIRSNEHVYVLCSFSPAFDENGSIFKIYLLGQDVTESKLMELKAQKQAEEIEQSLMELKIEQELTQQREQEMAALLQALDSTCLVTEIDTDGKITFINNKNVETLGDPKHAIEGKFHHEIDFQAKHNPKEYKQFWDDLMLGKLKQREFSLKVNNKTVWISEHYTPIKNAEGKVIKVITIGIDISESKEIERKLKETIASLEKMINK